LSSDPEAVSSEGKRPGAMALQTTERRFVFAGEAMGQKHDWRREKQGKSSPLEMGLRCEASIFVRWTEDAFDIE
jgi:hypothetical protein